MLDAPIFFSNHFRESHSQSHFQKHIDTERSNVSNQSILGLFQNLGILGLKNSSSQFHNALFSGFRETKTNCIPQRFRIDTHLSRPIGHKQICSTSVPRGFCSIRDKVDSHLRYSSVLLMRDALKHDCVTFVSILTLHFILVLMHMQGITRRNGVKITFKSPRRLSNSTLRFSFSKIMLSPPGCLTSCLNSCLKHDI